MPVWSVLPFVAMLVTVGAIWLYGLKGHGSGKNLGEVMGNRPVTGRARMAPPGRPTAILTGAASRTVDGALGVEFLPVPVLATSASGPVTVGATIADTAVLSGGDAASGAIMFRLFGPNDPTCAQAPVFVSTVPVAGDGSYRSASHAPSKPGVYQWAARYLGDARNGPTSEVCPSGAEASTVLIGIPSLITTVLEPAPVGAAISDVAVLVGGSKPSGTLVFTVFGPDDANCAQPPAFQFPPVTVSGGGSYTSGSFTPATAGTYQFVVTYSGDSDNVALGTRCDAPAQAAVVTPATLLITAQPPRPVSVGASIVGSETLSGGSQPTGSITFKIFGPNDALCSRLPAFTSPPVTVTGTGTYTSVPFTPAVPGSYNIVATYSGDANNSPETTTCGAPNQMVTVSRAIPDIAAEPTPPALVGQPVVVAETVSGGLNPKGTIGFSFYGPDDPTCTGRPQFSPPSQAISGDGAYRSPLFTPTTPGDTRFVVAYSGDVNNIPFTTDCNATNQALLVALSGVYDPVDHPRSVIELEVLALALVGLVGSAGIDRRSWSSSMATDAAASEDAPAPGRVISTGIDNTVEGWEAVVVVDAAVVGSGAASVVDRSRAWRAPGTRVLDHLSVRVPPKVAPASPLIARIANDAGYLRAILGSASTLLPLAGAALAVVAVLDVHGQALPPPFLLALAIGVLGVLDAFAGFVAVAVFVVGIIVSGGLATANDARILLGLSSLWFAAPIVAGVARPLRRAPTRSTAEHVERVADVIVAALVGSWAVKQIIEGLPGLAGTTLPIVGHASSAAIVVLAALALRMAIETVAAHRYPARLCEVQAAALPISGRAQHFSSAIFASVLFFFVALPYIGPCWQLYVGGAFFALPLLVRPWANRLPNFPRLYASVPRGVLRTVAMLFVGTALGAYVAAQLHDQNHQQIIRESFVILSVPGLVISILQLFGREGPAPPRIHWVPEKILGAVVVSAGILVVIGVVTV